MQAGELPRALSEDLTPETALGETMMLGLRLLRDGVSLVDVQARHGVDPCARYSAEMARFSELGLLTLQGDRLLLTERGALLANDVCAAFLP